MPFTQVYVSNKKHIKTGVPRLLEADSAVLVAVPLGSVLVDDAGVEAGAALAFVAGLLAVSDGLVLGVGTAVLGVGVADTVAAVVSEGDLAVALAGDEVLLEVASVRILHGGFVGPELLEVVLDAGVGVVVTDAGDTLVGHVLLVVGAGGLAVEHTGLEVGLVVEAFAEAIGTVTVATVLDVGDGTVDPEDVVGNLD